MSARPELLGARRIRELLDLHGVRPKKRLGQNFVIDPNTIRKVVEVAALDPSDVVLEVGAGPGSLTLGLAPAARRIIALEVDAGMLPVLSEAVKGAGDVEVVHADAMTFDFGSTDACRVVGNLPYNLAATIVLRVLEEAPQVKQLTVMSQREVGARLAAQPGSRLYGQTSLLVGFFGTATVAARVSRNAFWPVPNVDSVLVSIVRTPSPEVDYDAFKSVVKAGFAQRRKMLRTALAGPDGSPDEVTRLLENANLNPSARAEDLDLDAFVAVTRALRPRAGRL